MEKAWRQRRRNIDAKQGFTMITAEEAKESPIALGLGRGAEDLIDGIYESRGTCEYCEFFDDGMRDYCRRLNITTSAKWWCGDFERYPKKEKL